MGAGIHARIQSASCQECRSNTNSRFGCCAMPFGHSAFNFEFVYDLPFLAQLLCARLGGSKRLDVATVEAVGVAESSKTGIRRECNETRPAKPTAGPARPSPAGLGNQIRCIGWPQQKTMALTPHHEEGLTKCTRARGKAIRSNGIDPQRSPSCTRPKS